MESQQIRYYRKRDYWTLKHSNRNGKKRLCKNKAQCTTLICAVGTKRKGGALFEKRQAENF